MPFVSWLAKFSKKLVLLYTITSAPFCYAAVHPKSGLTIPRFISLKSDEVNLRSGPGFQYPIKWAYQRKGYPMEVTAEFENWKKLRDIDGTEGWVNSNLVTGKRRVVAVRRNDGNDTVQQEILLFKYPNDTARPIVRLEYGTIGDVKKCSQKWCKVLIRSYTGWIKKENLWGVYQDEVIH